MGLVKLGQFIKQSDERNKNGLYNANSVVGLSTQKQIIKTKADLQGVNLSSYKLMPPGYFAYVPDTSRRGDKTSLAYNHSEETYIVSSISIVFSVSRLDLLLPDYLFMYFNRPEFDRYARFNSWGSARETFSWNEMCDIRIDLPSLSVQQKYVDIYNAMAQNQYEYERGLGDMKLTYNAYIEKLRREIACEKIGPYLIESGKRNDCRLSAQSVRGLSTNKQFIMTKAKMKGVSLKNYKTVEPGQIAYVPDTSRRGEKISLGFNDTDETFLVSSISIVFGTNKKYLLPEYLMLFLTRPEFDRYARYNSWGSARETFSFPDMCDVKIPVPDLQTQRAITEIYTAYNNRKKINEQLKLQLQYICPILIRGSIEEASA